MTLAILFYALPIYPRSPTLGRCVPASSECWPCAALRHEIKPNLGKKWRTFPEAATHGRHCQKIGQLSVYALYVTAGTQPIKSCQAYLRKRRYRGECEATLRPWLRALKRPPGLPNTTTRTENDSGVDYADLEKRADGRWCMQTLSRMLEAAVVDGVHMTGKTPSRGTCCGCLPAHVGVLLLTMLSLMIGVVFIGVTGVNVAHNSATRPRS